MSAETVVFCGIDASSTCTGVAVFENEKLVYYSAIRPEGDSWRERIFNEGTPLDEIFKKYQPHKIFMEDVPLSPSGGYKTAIILGAVQGFVYGVACNNNIPIEFVSPSHWRSQAGLYDGTQQGKKREILKQKAIAMANDKFNLNLSWNGLHSKHSDDDIAEAILICATMTGVISNRKFGKPHC